MERQTISNVKQENDSIIEDAKITAEKIISESAIIKAIEKKAQEIKKEVLSEYSKMLFSKYKQTKHLHANFYAVKSFESKFFALFTDKGEQITNFKYAAIEPATGIADDEFMVTVYTNNTPKFGLINSSGEEFVPPVYENLFGWFCEGLAAVKLNGKYGYINRKNETVIPFIYDDANMFWGHKAEVKLNGRTFFIDKMGNEEL